MRWTALLGVCALACLPPAARADTRSVSYSTWIVSGDRVTLRYVLPAAEARRLSGSDVPVLTVSKLGDYVLSHVAVRASDHDCPAIDQGYDLGRVDPLQVGAGLYGFEIIFQCPSSPQAVTLVDRALFDRVPAHVDFARVETDQGSSEHLFTAARERLGISQSGHTPSAGPSQYARLGLLHILRSPDRLCLLLAALLLVQRKRELGYLLGALAGGYALSVLVQATDLILPQLRANDAFVGFLVALLATSLIVREAPRRHSAAVALGWSALLLILALIAALTHATHATLLLAGAALISGALLAALLGGEPPPRVALNALLVPASLFAFLDGFTLPALLAPSNLVQRAQVPMVAAFDAGAVLAAALVLGLAVGGFALLQARKLAPPYALLHDATAACFAGLGMYWLISRLHS
jgi:hypothetical protein